MKNVVISFLLIASLLSCKKYEDGPLFSIRSKKNRITGRWKVVEYGTYGNRNFSYRIEVDSIRCDTLGNWVVNTIPYNVNVSKIWTFDKDSSGFLDYTYSGYLTDFEKSKANCVLYKSDTTVSRNSRLFWYFNEDKSKLIMSSYFESRDWDILELKNHRIKLVDSG